LLEVSEFDAYLTLLRETPIGTITITITTITMATAMVMEGTAEMAAVEAEVGMEEEGAMAPIEGLMVMMAQCSGGGGGGGGDM
jgi:hypothetical protein